MSLIAIPTMENILKRLLEFCAAPSLDKEHRAWKAKIFMFAEQALVHYQCGSTGAYYNLSLDSLEEILTDLPGVFNNAEFKVWCRVANDLKNCRCPQSSQEELTPEIQETQRRRDKLRAKFSKKSR